MGEGFQMNLGEEEEGSRPSPQDRRLHPPATTGEDAESRSRQRKRISGTSARAPRRLRDRG